MTTTEKIAALRAIHEASTEGTWMYGTPGDDCEQTRAEWMAGCAKEPDGSAAGSLWAAWQQRGGELLIPAITGDGPTSEHNAHAIVSAHNNLPALLKALEDVLGIEAAPSRPDMQPHDRDWADGYNDARREFRTAIEAALAEVDHG